MPTLRGRVVEKWSNLPIANALVNIGGVSVLTSDSGEFLTEVASMQPLIKAVHLGHETVSAVVALDVGDNEVVIEMKPIVRML